MEIQTPLETPAQPYTAQLHSIDVSATLSNQQFIAQLYTISKGEQDTPINVISMDGAEKLWLKVNDDASVDMLDLIVVLRDYDYNEHKNDKNTTLTK